MKDTNNAVAAVVIIGRPDNEEFASLLAFIRQHPAIRITGEYEQISEALEAGLGERIATDIAVVLQSSSDQYSKEESNHLIGCLLFGRVVCCYGPWCMADGRSHDIWPVSTRVSLASAEMLLSMELAAFAAGDSPLSPMSAGEDVFVHRISRSAVRTERRGARAFVICSERPLRRTIAGILNDAGLENQQITMEIDALREAIRLAEVSPRIAIVDLDPPETSVKEMLTELSAAFPNLRVLGLTVFPHAAFFVGPLHAIIDKTELMIQLQCELNQCC